MSRRTSLVTTGSRLHFGMLSFGQQAMRQFGGLGVMIDEPGVKVRFTSAEDLTISGPLADTVRRHVEAIGRADWFNRPLACHVEVLAAPPPHIGLGSGTQLALAVAAGLALFFDVPAPRTADLVRTLGRGRRSAVGLYGFLYGGLIVEAGKYEEDEVSPLVSRVVLPPDWRFLLVRQTNGEGLSGDAERRAFERLPRVPRESSARMCEEALLELVPAAIQQRIDLFSQALFRFGQEAGRCFAHQQEGVYATDLAAATVAELRRLGAVGVAQSSWGPTVFAVLPNKQNAEEIRQRIEQGTLADVVTCQIVSPLNDPARLELLTD